MTDSNVIELVRRLQATTKTGNARWSKTADEGVFNLSFSDYSIQVSKREEWELNDSYETFVIQIFDSNGELVEEIKPSDFDQADFAYNDDPLDVFKSIYSSARRTAMGMDKAILSILNELPQVEEAEGSPPRSPDDDIPC